MSEVLNYIRKVLIFAGKVKLGMMIIELVLESGKKYNNKESKEPEQLDYYDIVRYVASSNAMLGSTRQEIIDALDRTKPEAYYKAVYSILESDMLSSTKIEMIKSLS